MPARPFNHLWRVFATGLSFTTFGIGGVLLGLIAFPLLNLLVWQRQRRNRIARSLVRHSFGAFIQLMRVLGVLSYELHGVDRLQREGLLVLANHPTLIDVVFLGWLTPNADCVVKSALLRNPVMIGPVSATGYIVNASGPGLIADCVSSLRGGGNLLIFPEGTRSPPGGFGALQRGAANVAVRAPVDLTPVIITCNPPTLGKGGRWYRVPSRRFHIRIDVRPDLAVAPFLDGDSLDGTSPGMAARRLTEHLREYFEMELARARA